VGLRSLESPLNSTFPFLRTRSEGRSPTGEGEKGIVGGTPPTPPDLLRRPRGF